MLAHYIFAASAVLYGVFMKFGIAEALTVEVKNPFKFNTFCGLILAFTQALLVISIAVGLVVIVYAGFLFMTSSGEPARVKAGKDALFYAILGMIVGVSARAIVAVVYNFFGASLGSCT